VAAAIIEQCSVFLSPREAFGDDKKKAASDSKVRDKDVQHRDQGNQHAAWDRELPVWIVQGAVSGKANESSVSSTPSRIQRKFENNLGSYESIHPRMEAPG